MRKFKLQLNWYDNNCGLIYILCSKLFCLFDTKALNIKLRRYVMDAKKLEELVEKFSNELKDLKSRGILIISALGEGELLENLNKSETNAKILSDLSDEVFTNLITSDFIKNYPHPVLIDFSKTVALYNGSSQSENDKIQTAFMMSRVNFMGTDGIRGKVVTDSDTDFISALLADNAFTPQLVETTSFSFAQILLSENILVKGDTVVIGNDGRDLAYDWILNRSVITGFNRAGLNVLDTGIVPTAIVPFKMLQKNMRGGAVLTASHNPSNQNGIKFFIDGKKLLPEGKLGDYILSSNMYKFCYLEKMPEPTGTLTNAEGIVDESVKFVMDVLPENISDIIKDETVVFDSANGAFDEIGRKVLDKIGVTYTSVNEQPKGSNINRSCGVAEIEGTEFFDGKEYETFIPTVKEIFDRGRKNGAGKTWGIVLDGDGDRGFLMYYDKKIDAIHVLDGDKCGYMLSEYFVKSKKLNPKDYWFISTIESDIMTATTAKENLGLNTQVVSVGDKWICNFEKGKVLVGLEISGHLIFPIAVKTDSGDTKELLSGVGLLTPLMALVALKALDLNEEKIIEPFEPGVSNTNYIFFVDKTKFYRNSKIWQNDSKMIIDEVEKLKAESLLPSNTKLDFEDKEDPNVLYINFLDGDKLLGCIFLRNSGTEDKNAVYVKGSSSIKEALLKLGKTLQASHTEIMKNENRIEYKYEKFIIKTLQENSDTPFKEVKIALEKDTNTTIIESDLYSVVYGLKKEQRISLEDDILKLK